MGRTQHLVEQLKWSRTLAMSGVQRRGSSGAKWIRELVVDWQKIADLIRFCALCIFIIHLRNTRLSAHQCHLP